MKNIIKRLTIVIAIISTIAYAALSLNDPLYPDQWYLNKLGIFNEGNYDIGFEEFKNSGIQEFEETVTVIIGAGVKKDHEDLIDSLWINPDEIPGNNIDDDLNGYVDDIHGVNVSELNGEIDDLTGVGTAISAIIGAKQNNNVGISGISTTTKIAHCKLYGNESIYKYDAISRCIDYVIDIKNVKNKKISSVLFDFVISSNAVYDIQTLKPIFAKLTENDILLVAPADMVYHVDYYEDYPYSYLMSNVLLVSALNTNGFMFGAIGENSIATIAPGNFIRSASSLSALESNGENIAYFEQSDIPQEQLTNSSVSDAEYTTGIQSWKFDIGDEDSIVELNSIDLFDYKDKEIVISFDSLNSTNYAHFVQYYNQEFQRWDGIYFGSDTGKAWHHFSHKFSLTEEMYGSLSDFRIRILIQGFAGQDDITYIDNIQLFDAFNAVEKNKYTNVSGTAMAAAQVSGIIAILKSTTNLENWQIRNLIISSGELLVDYVDESREFEVSLGNKLIKIFGDNANGVLNCENQKIQRRIYPSAEMWIPRVIGKEFIVKGIKINCESKDGELSILDELTGKIYTSTDNGLEQDDLADDGYNITKIDFDSVGKHTLKIESDNDLTVYTSFPYQAPKKKNIIWSNLTMGNNFSTTIFDFPFKLKFGGLQEGVSDHISFISSWGRLTVGQSQKFGSDDPYVDPDGDIKTGKKLDLLASNRHKTNNPLLKFKLPPTEEYDPNFIRNGISNALEEKVNYFTFYLPPSSDSFSFNQINRVYGDEGSRVVVIDVSPRDNGITEFTGKFQVVLFEKNSTIVYSYKEFSDNIISRIEKRGIQIGHNYELLIEEPFENNVSYIFKEDDGINLTPTLINNIIEIRQNEEINIDLNELYSDLDHDSLFFSTTLEESFITIDQLGIFSSTLGEELSIGDEISFELEATDGEETITNEITIRVVVPINNPPKLNLEKISLTTSEEFFIDISEYLSDVEGDDILVTAIDLAYNFQLNADNILTGKLMKSDYPLDITELVVDLSDGTNNVQHSIFIELILVNHAPEQTNNFGTIRVEEGKSTTRELNDYFFDIDEDELSFSTTSSIAEIIVEGNNPSLRIAGDNVGNYVVELEVDDHDGGLTSVDITVQVVAKQNQNIAGSESSGGGAFSYFYLLFIVYIAWFRSNYLLLKSKTIRFLP